MKKIFLDSDVILDLILKREPYVQHITLLFEKARGDNYFLFTSSISILNINYLLRKSYSKESVKEIISKILVYIKILSVDSNIITSSFNSDFNDIEDAVQYYCALHNDINEIISRNIKDYKHSKIPVLTPLEFLKTGI